MYQLFIEIQTSSAFIYITDKKKEMILILTFLQSNSSQSFHFWSLDIITMVMVNILSTNELLVGKLCYAGHKRKL